MFLVILCTSLLTNSSPRSDRADSIALLQAFKDLTHPGVVMDISAHPDDEDGATLAYYRMHEGAATYSVLFTRGEGGQNEKGPELYEDLGVIRSEETEAAGAILGTSVHFLNFKDFGYSKSATESFRFWGGELEPLRRLTLMIRRYRPDILFTNHNTVDGHGHHQAAGLTALAAFDAAADSTMFPEQLRLPGIALWQPKKLYMRQFARTPLPADVTHLVDAVDPVRQESYLEIATAALQKHATQGLDRASLRAFTRGRSQYRLMRASSLFERDTTTFFGGLDLWGDPEMRLLLPVRREIEELRPGIPREQLLRILSGLLQELTSIGAHSTLAGIGERTAGRWMATLQRIALLTAGGKITIGSPDSMWVARQRIRLKVGIEASEAKVADLRTSVRVPEGWEVSEEPESGIIGFRVGDSPIPTVPRSSMQYRPLEGIQEVVAMLDCRLDGYPFRFTAQVPFDIASRQELAVTPETPWGDPDHLAAGIRLGVRVTNRMQMKSAGKVRLLSPSGWKMDPFRFTISDEDGSAEGNVVILPPHGTPEGDYTLRLATEDAARDVRVRLFRVRVAPGLRVGIVRSYDDALEAACQRLGVAHTSLTDADLAGGDLSKWHTIVVDIRAYLNRAGLRESNSRLLDYVRNGGHLVVMYQRDQEWKPEYAPFPLNISRSRISREDAPVTLLQPDHPFWHHPNEISNADWGGWTQERALYLPADVSPSYQRMLDSRDPDEPVNDTGLLLAPYGKGTYCYTSYVWYRQLKEMHAGAFRCFANMISYPLSGR